MAIAYVTSSSQNFANAGSSTYTHSFTASGTDRFVAILVATDRTSMAISSATYAGNAMTAFAATLANAQGECNTRGFYIAGDASIPTGAQNIVVTFGAATSNNPCVIAICYQGVDSASPVSAAAMVDHSSGGNTTTVSSAVSSASGDLVCILTQQGYGQGVNPSFTPNGSTTSRDHDDYGSGVIRSLNAADAAGDTSVTVGGTQSPSSRAQSVVWSLNALGAAGGVPATNLFMMGVG